jgi:hypothetical protein
MNQKRSKQKNSENKGLPFRTRDLAIAGLVIVIALAITFIVITAIVFQQLTSQYNQIQALQDTINGTTTPAGNITLCTGSNTLPIYSQLVTAGNYIIQTSTFSYPNATVQRNGLPEIILCNTLNQGQTAIYSYIAADGDPVTTSYGTSVNPPSGFNLGNGGSPIGYCYTSQFGQTVLNPIYLLSVILNSGVSTNTIMSYQNSVVYGTNTYSRTSNIPIGYGL